MENFYAPKNPIIGAYYIVHFNKSEEPCFIERDLVASPLTLQRLVFPWIEHASDKDYKDQPEKKKDWGKECNKETEGVDPNDVAEGDIFWVTTATMRLSTKLNSSALLDSIDSLKLLVQMDRTILQDAVLYMEINSGDQTLTNRLIISLQEIFKSKMFLDFKA
ncbi:hypothetical protein BGZ54_005281 [Gamsiella multidivaricata]|nr:hypothetical protein BGZ54_005281 [Gamsiella multidivaricata]